MSHLHGVKVLLYGLGKSTKEMSFPFKHSWPFEQPGLVEDVPADGRRVGLVDL